MATLSVQSETNAVEAVWYIIQSQSASVRKAITKRLLDLEKEKNTKGQQKKVKESLSRAFDELVEVKRTGRQLPDARDLFK